MPRYPETKYDAEIVDRYDNGELFSMHEIGRQLGKSASFVRDRLVANGVVIDSNKSGGKKLEPVEYQRTLFLFDKMEMNPDEIAAVLGVHQTTIRRRLKKRGRKLRKTKYSPFAKKGGVIDGFEK